MSILSDRRLLVPELPDDEGSGARVEFARKGFNVIATANLRDRGVSEMSAALKRRFNFETVAPIGDLVSEVALEIKPVVRILRELAEARPVAPMITCGDETITRDDMEARSNRLARAYAELGVGFGDFVTIGHSAVVHACRVMNNVRIGIGAVVLDGAVVEEGAQVGAGALVPPGKIVPAGWLVMGVPAKPIRKMDAAELEDILKNARDYIELWHRDYR